MLLALTVQAANFTDPATPPTHPPIRTLLGEAQITSHKRLRERYVVLAAMKVSAVALTHIHVHIHIQRITRVSS